RVFPKFSSVSTCDRSGTAGSRHLPKTGCNRPIAEPTAFQLRHPGSSCNHRPKCHPLRLEAKFQLDSEQDRKERFELARVQMILWDVVRAQNHRTASGRERQPRNVACKKIDEGL